MKLNNPTYQDLWERLQPIFLSDYRGVTKKMIKDLQKLGFEVYGNKHPKIRVLNKVVVLTSSSGRLQTGREILRIIRRILENGKND